MFIDARGLGCPKPVIMAEEAISKIDEGSVDILIDNEASLRNLMRFARKSGLSSEEVRENGHWRVKLVKGYVCEPSQAESAAGMTEEKDLFCIVGSDTMGKEEALGRVLMKAFFETMLVTGEMPHTIFFLNAGVKLTTTDEEMIPILRSIGEKGVEIFSCGTCLKHYDLESSLRVGYRGTTNHIVEGLKDFKRTVWIG
ncbi:MAG TPA: sulfurtransferase-like selenium metabolism protein YedF [Dissulfurispiraceae bacterium]|nr:sulfurtransferase-like selenium metabolism protein YedF [Dissulfurispiraceae bacterium]